MQQSATAVAIQQRRTSKWAVAIALMIVAAYAYFSGPLAAHAATPNFPRLGMWWPNNSAQSVADRARYDWILLQNSDSSRIAELHAANPNEKVLGSTNARELNYVLGNYNDPHNVELRSAAPEWMLTQAGSTLTANITNAQTSIPVGDTSRFRTGDMVLIDHELMNVQSIGTGVINVIRGQVTPAASHTSGTRIAATVQAWPGTIEFDVSTNCPKVDVGAGPETWNDWNVRRGKRVMTSAPWDGLLIDCNDGSPSWMVIVGQTRSIDWNRSNVVPSSYTTFDNAWNTGMQAYGAGLRTALGSSAVIIGNMAVKQYALSGRNFETFPTSGLALANWTAAVIGPYPAGTPWPAASYLDWTNNGATYSTIETYEFDNGSPAGWDWDGFVQPGFVPNYQKMRYGLTTALLGDGYFSYEISTNGHGTQGLMWFDEYDNAGAGRGYLGQPTGVATQQTGGVWRRDYSGGIALVNPTDSPVTVQLGGTFKKIKGTQAPTVNDGSLVTQVTLQSRDGIVLLRTTPVTPADTTAPTTTSDAQLTYVSSATIKLTATDNVGVKATYYTLDGGAQQTGNTVTVSTLGTHTLAFWSVDAAGNTESRKSVTFTVTTPPDTTAPSTTSDAKTTYVSSATINLTASDNVGVTGTYYILDGGAQQSGLKVTSNTIGTHTLQYWSVDAAGNVESRKSVTFSITAPLPPADTTAPVTTSDALASYIGLATIHLTASDNVGVTATYYVVDGGAQQSGTTVSVGTAGTHTLQYWSVDAAGNVETRKSATFSVTTPDTTAPSTTSDAKTSYVSSATINLTASDNVGVTGTYYILDGGAQQSGTTVSVGTVGTHTLQYWSVDAAGNVETRTSVTFSITAPVPDPVPTPDPTVTPDPTTTPVPAPVVYAPKLTSDSYSLKYGQTTTLHIGVSPAGPVQVRVESKTATSIDWVGIALLTTDASGNISLPVGPLATTDYRVVVVPDGSVSNVISVRVRAVASAKGSKNTVVKASSLTVSGTVSSATTTLTRLSMLASIANVDGTNPPKVAPACAVLQQKLGKGGWKTIRVLRLSSTGGYKVKLYPRVRGTRYFRVVVSATSLNETGYSNNVKLAVR